MSNRLSVVMATYNEEENIEACLSSVVQIADEIIIVDGESQDHTVSIAKKFGAICHIVPNQKNFHINKNMAISFATGELILQLDADERISAQLSDEINKIKATDISLLLPAYYLKRRNFFLGRWMNKGGMYPDPVIRLFQKGKATLPAESVHELMKVDGEVGWLQNDLLHIADPTFSRYLRRSNRYTSLQAEEWLRENTIHLTTFSIIKYCILLPLVRFFTLFIRHRGYQDGFPGFVFAMYSGLHIASSFVKYYEKRVSQKGVTLKGDWE